MKKRPERHRVGSLPEQKMNFSMRASLGGVDPDRVYSVAGKAGSDPLYPDDPSLAGNRRIAIVLLREAPVLPRDTSL